MSGQTGGGVGGVAGHLAAGGLPLAGAGGLEGVGGVAGIGGLPTCSATQKDCLGECIDQAACCGNAECPTGESCVGHVCTCNQGTKRCDASCIPDANCCSAVDCADGASCDQGQCVCPTATHACDDVHACVSDTSPNTCGTSCDPCVAPTGGTVGCDGVQCQPMCPGGQRPCLGACIDSATPCTGQCPSGSHDCSGVCVLATSTNACGQSCTPCGVPANGQATCDGTECGISCSSGYKQCGSECIATSACCTNADCPASSTCTENHQCACNSGLKQCNDECIASSACCTTAECQANATCSAAHTCDCSSGYKACNGQCIATSACCASTECQANASCSAAHTCDCNSGYKACNGQCIATSACCTNADCQTNASCSAANACVCNSGYTACSGRCIPAITGSTATGTTNGGTNNFTLSCGSGSSSDIAFGWTAPDTDYYTFDTAGSSFDTVLGVLSSCGGSELACNNNNGSSPQSRAVAKVNGGQSVVVVVDGQAGARGNVSLNISPVTCPGTDVTGATFPASFTTVGGTNTHEGACGVASMPEKSIRYTAPSAGLYKFSVSSTEFSPALYVYEGVICGGLLLECNWAYGSSEPATVTRYLDANESVTLIVDGHDTAAPSAGQGAFQLNVQRLSVSCPSEPAFSGTLANQQISYTNSSLLTGQCVRAGSPSGGFADRSYPIHVNEALPDGACGVTVQLTGAGGVPSMTYYLLRGSRCDGEELLCETFTGDYDPHTILFTAASNTMGNGDYVLVVEFGYYIGSITYSVTTDCG